MFNVFQYCLKGLLKGVKKIIMRLLPDDDRVMNFKVVMISLVGVFGGLLCCLFQIKLSHNYYLLFGTIASLSIILGVYFLRRNFQNDDISKFNYFVLWGLIALNEITSIILNYYMHGTKWPNQTSVFHFYIITMFIFSIYCSGALLCAIFGPIKQFTKEPIVYFGEISIILLVVGGIVSFFVNLLWFIGFILVLISVLRQLLDYFKIILPARITKKKDFIKDTDGLEQQLLLAGFVSIIFKILISLISLYSPIYRIIQPSFNFVIGTQSFEKIVKDLLFVLTRVVVIVLLVVFLRKGIIKGLDEVRKQIERIFPEI